MDYPAPSHLPANTVETDKAIISKVQKNYGDNTTIFRLIKKYKQLLFSWIDEYDQYDGIVWGVDETANKDLLFDRIEHGYNGVMQLETKNENYSTRSIDLTPGTDLVVGFQYNGEEEEYTEEGTSEFLQDYYGWMAIYSYDNGKLKEIISFETA